MILIYRNTTSKWTKEFVIVQQLNKLRKCAAVSNCKKRKPAKLVKPAGLAMYNQGLI